jgi:hypothetical protein
MLLIETIISNCSLLAPPSFCFLVPETPKDELVVPKVGTDRYNVAIQMLFLVEISDESLSQHKW